MKITPLEIRQKTFEKVFRGLDKDEVNAFLITMSQEWEKLLDENKELSIKLEASEKEVEKLREVENSLFKTLKTAEDTGANMIDQATKTAELHMRETQMKADAIMNEAKAKAKDMMEEAEMRSRNTLEDMEDKVRSLAHLYKNLENVNQDLLSDIKTFANEALEKVERVKTQMKKMDIDDELARIKRSINTKHTTLHSPEAETNDHSNSPATPTAPEKVEKVPSQVEVPTSSKVEHTPDEKKSTSFFDDI